MNDRPLDIALGSSRKTKTWKNKAVTWAELLNRLSQTTRTAETVAEYKAMSLARQSEIKDVGGFVGGYCDNGSRTAVRHRSILCLDADFADSDLWPDWCTFYGNTAAVYSTHKHTPDKPRIRLVVPLARDVSPDEYQAIGRRVADTLGIEKFDDTSYQPQRVMYWPSTSQDGEYLYEHQDGEMLNPDAVLATYHNWRDVSSWPMSNRVAEIAHKTVEKQQDPLDKGGVVGAFCRAYTIQEAIAEYVPTYQPCDDPGRYTYTEGSTAAGVVIYDDKFSYSHHATDPASGQLCNAWDLVRMHRFGDLDADCDPDTPLRKRPSTKAMRDLATQDSRVSAQMARERLAEADKDFEAPPDEVDDKAWLGQLKYTDRGALAQTIDNGVLILSNDPKLKDRIALNEMSHDIVVRQPMPWASAGTPRQWTDADDAALRYYLEKSYGLTSKDRIFDAVNVVATNNKYHPVREYLDDCTWDGVPRVDTLLIDCLGAEDTPYTRAVTRKTLAAAVARVYRPGIKFDTMLTIQGEQGIGKSALISKLGGHWYSDTFTTMQGKEAYEQVQGVWILEIGELDAMKKAETSTVKLFIAKTADRFRPAYGRRTQEFPRQCVFIGSVNETTFLRDATGGRRFWIVRTPNATPRCWNDKLAQLDDATVRQVWAEAVTIYKAGEPLYLPAELERVAIAIQASAEEENPKAGVVEDYLDRLLPADWNDRDLYARRQWLETSAEGTERRMYVCTREILAEALNANPDRTDRYDYREISGIMAQLPGWTYQGEKKRRFGPHGNQRYYMREDMNL